MPDRFGTAEAGFGLRVTHVRHLIRSRIDCGWGEIPLAGVSAEPLALVGAGRPFRWIGAGKDGGDVRAGLISCWPDCPGHPEAAPAMG